VGYYSAEWVDPPLIEVPLLGFVYLPEVSKNKKLNVLDSSSAEVESQAMAIVN